MGPLTQQAGEVLHVVPCCHVAGVAGLASPGSASAHLRLRRCTTTRILTCAAKELDVPGQLIEAGRGLAALAGLLGCPGNASSAKLPER